jgi:hypothetical protein
MMLFPTDAMCDLLEIWRDDPPAAGQTFSLEDVKKIAAQAASEAVAADRKKREDEAAEAQRKEAEAARPKPLTPQMQQQLGYYKDHPDEWRQLVGAVDEATGGETGKKVRELELRDATRDLLEEFKLGKSALALLTADTLDGRKAQAKALRTELDAASNTKTGGPDPAGSDKDEPVPATAKGPELRPVSGTPDAASELQRHLSAMKNKAEA